MGAGSWELVPSYGRSLKSARTSRMIRAGAEVGLMPNTPRNQRCPGVTALPSDFAISPKPRREQCPLTTRRRMGTPRPSTDRGGPRTLALRRRRARAPPAGVAATMWARAGAGDAPAPADPRARPRSRGRKAQRPTPATAATTAPTHRRRCFSGLLAVGGLPAACLVSRPGCLAAGASCLVHVPPAGATRRARCAHAYRVQMQTRPRI